MISISQAVFLTLAVARKKPDAQDYEIDSAINFVDNMFDDIDFEDAMQHTSDLDSMVCSVCDAIDVNREMDRPIPTYVDLIAA